MFPLLGVRLLCRVSIVKRRDGHAGLINPHHPPVGIKRAVEGLGGRYLGDEANVRDRRPLAMTEPAARGVFGKQCLHRLQARAKPMLDPGGTVNLSGRVGWIQATGSGHWGLLPTHATDFGPDLEFLGSGGSLLGGSDVIAAEMEKVIDLIVG